MKCRGNNKHYYFVRTTCSAISPDSVSPLADTSMISEGSLVCIYLTVNWIFQTSIAFIYIGCHRAWSMSCCSMYCILFVWKKIMWTNWGLCTPTPPPQLVPPLPSRNAGAAHALYHGALRYYCVTNVLLMCVSCCVSVLDTSNCIDSRFATQYTMG